MAELDPGTVIDGRYRVISRLGSGGMADVFLAEDQQLGRHLALKLLHRRFAEDPGFVERFRREAQAAAGLQHPNVVSVYDRGAYDGTYYIAMEYIPGRSLKQLVRQEAPIEPLRAIDITIQILKAARFAHRHGVIHRDLKPHNVIVDDSGHVKVTDFGIARAGASDMTETGSIMGTAQYLSPEQAQGHAVSATSDLYSIGVVLYELLTGHVPFDAEAAVTIALKHVSEVPAAPTRINPKIPPELESVVMWALNKNPADRPKDADEFIAALEASRAAILAGTRGERTASMAAVGGGVPVGGVGLAAAPGPEVAAPPPTSSPPAYVPASADNGGGGAPTAPPAAQQHENGRGSDPWFWIALVLVLLIIGGGAAAFLLTRTPRVVVPNVIGQQINTARTVLQNKGFGVSVVQEPNSKSPGTVLGEIPTGGSKAKRGSNIALTVSSGPSSVSIPSVLGRPEAAAKRALARAGLKIGSIVSQSSGQIAAGHVIGTDPGAGHPVPIGSFVTLIVSTGAPNVNVPSVTGEPEASAKHDLQNAGFTNITTTTQTSTTVRPGHVISQSPSGGSPARPNSPVTLVIATAPTTATIPYVHGDTVAQASSALRKAGFSVAQQSKPVTDPNKNGLVLSVTPHAGSTAKKGSTVTLLVGQYTPPTTSTTTPSSPTTPTTPITP
jgi:eukaryotic-like serine/threonine-protein kinase